MNGVVEVVKSQYLNQDQRVISDFRAYFLLKLKVFGYFWFTSTINLLCFLPIRSKASFAFSMRVACEWYSVCRCRQFYQQKRCRKKCCTWFCQFSGSNRWNQRQRCTSNCYWTGRSITSTWASTTIYASRIGSNVWSMYKLAMDLSSLCLCSCLMVYIIDLHHRPDAARKTLGKRIDVLTTLVAKALLNVLSNNR